MVAGLVESGSDVRVVTMAVSSRTPGVRNVSRLPVIFNRKFLNLMPLIPAVLWRVIVNRPDYLVAMTWTHDGMAAWIASILLRVPYAIVVHGSDIDPIRRGRLRRTMRWFIMKRASVLISNSEYTRHLIDNSDLPRRPNATVNPSATRLTVSETSVAGQSPNGTDGTDGRRFVLLTVARLIRRKGHATVIRALSSLVSTYPLLIYEIVGDGPERLKLERLVDELDLHGNVRFHGECSDSEVDEHYRSTDIYVSPSMEVNGDGKGFGISYIEAALYGVPSVAGDSGGSAEAVLDGITGIVVQPDDSDALARAIQKFIDEPELQKKMGRAALKRAEREFSPRQKASELLNILEKI